MVLISATAEYERNGARMMRKARSSESRDLYNVTSNHARLENKTIINDPLTVNELFI